MTVKKLLKHMYKDQHIRIEGHDGNYWVNTTAKSEAVWKVYADHEITTICTGVYYPTGTADIPMAIPTIVLYVKRGKKNER